MLWKKKSESWNWRNSPVVKSTGCLKHPAFRGCGFDSQNPYGSSHLFVIPIPGLWQPLLASAGTRHACIIKTNMQTKYPIHKKITNKLFFSSEKKENQLSSCPHSSNFEAKEQRKPYHSRDWDQEEGMWKGFVGSVPASVKTGGGLGRWRILCP